MNDYRRRGQSARFRDRCVALFAALGALESGCGSRSTEHDAGVVSSDVVGTDVVSIDVLLDTPAPIDGPLMLADAPLPDAAVVSPRPLAPLSTSVVRSLRPVLRWLLPPGAADVVLEICADRACATVEQSAPALGHGGAPSRDLAIGVHWWRLRSASTGTSPAWELFARPGVGAQVADVVDGTVADVDGDGLADLAVGATHADTEAGRVYVHRGRRGGIATTADTVLMSPAVTAGHFGWAVSAVGDVDGDGFDDLVVSAPDVDSGSGNVFVYRGGAEGLATMPATTLVAPDAGGNFGAALASGGDVNGDGYADVVVSAPNAVSSTGRAYVYLGSAAGLATTPSAAIDGTDGVGSTFGASVAMLGDANHDGLADVAIGAAGAGATVGVAHVFYGTLAGLGARSDLTLQSPSTEAGEFGTAVAGVGDVNGDGYADLAITAPQTLGGDAFLYLGSASGYGQVPAAAVSGPDGPRGAFGWSVGAAGDVDGDGDDDVVVTAVCAPFHLDPDGGYPTCGAGRAYIFAGSSAEMWATPPTRLDGPVGELAEFGWSSAGVRDLDGDGFDDLVIGAAASGGYAGSVMVFGGATHGLATTPVVVLTGTDGTGADFGWSVATREWVRRPATS